MQEVVGSSPIIRFDESKKCLHIGISYARTQNLLPA